MVGSAIHFFFKVFKLVFQGMACLWGYLSDDRAFMQGGRGQRAVCYTSPQSVIINVSYSLAQQP